MMSKKGILRVFLLLTSVILLISIISATFSAGSPNHSIEKKYGASQNIMGWINISTSNENANSLFNDSLNNQVSLLNLLKQNPSANYTCVPEDCGKDYTASNQADSKTFNLNKGESKIYGLRVDGGNFDRINSFSLNILSTAGESGSTQLKIDILNDGSTDWGNYKPSNNFGDKNYGCYEGSPGGNALINSTEYCNKITVQPTPNLTLGAIVTVVDVGNINFKISVDDPDGNYASCIASASGTGEISCSLNKYIVNAETELFLCIKKESSSGNGKYKINYIINDECRESRDPNFEIFARPSNYSAMGEFVLNNTEIDNYGELSPTAEDYMSDWIYNRYNNNCSQGCIIPINFTSKTDQSITLFGLSMTYDILIGSTYITASTDKIHDLTESPAKISSSFGKLYLDNAGLKVKNSTGNFTYILNFNGKKIFEEKLFVEKTPIIRGLSPLKTAYAFPTQFQLNVDSPGNISRYEWNFGDNSTVIVTATNKITHTYNDSGIYDLKTVIKDKNNISSSRTFSITVTSPGSLINSTLIEMKKDLTSVKNQINSYDLFYRARLGEIINTNNLSLKINELENKYNATNEGDYNLIVSEMLSLKIPKAITTSKATAAGFVFYPKKDNINIDVLRNIERGNYNESDETYSQAVAEWNTEKIASSLAFKEISIRYEAESQPVLRGFEFNVQEKVALDYPAYFIVKNMDNLKFKENYGEKDIEGYKYIELTGGTKEIVFSTTEDLNFENVPAFVSPGLSELSILKPGIPTETVTPFNWQAFIVAILLLLVIGFITYLILQRWYKNRYESHLFKNKNDLYNLLHFIEVQRRKGASEGEIHEKLKKTGWDPEQVKYSMKKHSGKRTGMLEIPVEKLFGIFEKKGGESHQR